MTYIGDSLRYDDRGGLNFASAPDLDTHNLMSLSETDLVHAVGFMLREYAATSEGRRGLRHRKQRGDWDKNIAQ